MKDVDFKDQVIGNTLDPDLLFGIFSFAFGTRGDGNVPGPYTVYRSVENGITEYVGITKRFAQRRSEHFRVGRIIEEIPGLNNLSRYKARGVEQVLIEHFGRSKYGTGTLSNLNNSISPSRGPYYNNAIILGTNMLDNIVPGWRNWR